MYVMFERLCKVRAEADKLGSPLLHSVRDEGFRPNQ